MSQLDVETDVVDPGRDRARPISASQIIVAGAAFGLLALVASFFVNLSLAFFAGLPAAKLAAWVDRETAVYCNWAEVHNAAPDDLPDAWQASAEQARSKSVAAAAKALRTTPKALEAAWVHVRGVEVTLPALGCVHFDSGDYLASWLTDELGLKDPILTQGRPAYRVSASLFLAPLGETLLIASSLSQVEAAVGRADAEPGSSLAEDERFGLAARAYGRTGLGWGYFQPSGLTNAASALGKRFEPRSVAGLLLGLASARASAAAFELARGRAVVSATVFAADGQSRDKEASAWLGLRNTRDKALLRFVPANANWFIALSIDKPAVFWPAFRRWASGAGPKRGLRSEIELELARLETAYAVDIKNDIVPWIGHEIVLFSVGLDGQSESGVLALAAEAASTKEGLITFARMEGGPELRNTKYENQRFKGKDLRVAELDEGLSYAAADGCVLASPRAQALRGAIAAAQDGRNMAASPRPAFCRARESAQRDCALLAGIRVDLLPWLPEVGAEGSDGPGFAAIIGVAAADRLSLTAVVPWDSRSDPPPAAGGPSPARRPPPLKGLRKVHAPEADRSLPPPLGRDMMRSRP